MISKGVLVVLLFTGHIELKPFDYTVTINTPPDEQVMACDARATVVRSTIATHSWDDPRGHGFYLNDGTGTVVGSIC